MTVGESEKILGNFMGICLFLGVCVLDFFIWLFYTWVSLICLYSSYGHLAAPSPAAGKALCIMFFFLLGFILSFNFVFVFVSYKHCMQIVRRNLVLGVLDSVMRAWIANHWDR